MKKSVIEEIACIVNYVISDGLDEDAHWRARNYVVNKEDLPSPLIIEWNEVFNFLLKNEEFIEHLNEMIRPLKENDEMFNLLKKK